MDAICYKKKIKNIQETKVEAHYLNLGILKEKAAFVGGLRLL